MGVTVSHVLTATTPDNPAYEIRPSHWNSAHAVSIDPTWISAGANSTSVGTVQFSNANGVSFGMDNAGNITATVQPGAAAGIAAIQVSNTTYTSGTVIFSNANGISFGSSAGGAVTGSYTVPSTAGLISAINVSAGATSNNLSALTFSNANGLSFGLNASTITASYTVPTQTNQTAGIYGSSQTFGQSSSSTHDARSLTIVGSGGVSVGWSNSSLLISGQTTAAQTNQTAGIYGSSQTYGQSSSSTYDARSLTVVGSGGVSVGWSNSSLLISGQTTAAQTNQSLGIYGSSQTTGQSSSSTYDARSLTIVGAGLVSVGWSNSSLIISGTAAGGAAPAASAANGSFSFNTASFSNVNNVSFATAAGSAIQGSFALNVSATGGTSNALSGLTFKDSQGVSFGLSTGAGVGTITASVAAQSNQTGGIYVTAQSTGQSSSSTYDLRTLSIVPDGIISAGWSGGSFRISATQSNQAVSNSAGSFTFQTLNFSNANNVTFGTSAGGVVTASVAAPGAAAENNWVSLLGNNTAGNVTASGSTIGLSGINLTLSGTNNSAINISAPATSSLVGTNAIFVSSAGSTISVGYPMQSYLEPPVRGGTSSMQIANGTVYFQPFEVQAPVSMYRLQLLQWLPSQATQTITISGSVSGGNATSGTATFGRSATALLYSRVSTGTDPNSSNIVSFYSNSVSYSLGNSASVSWSTNGSSATVSFSTSEAMGFYSSFGSDGGITSGSVSSSGTNTFSSTSTNAHTFNSTTTASFLSAVMSNMRPMIIPFATSLSPGEYWLAFLQSSGTARTNMSLEAVLRNDPGYVAYTTNTTGYAEMGNTAQISSSNVIAGWGSYSASTQTSTTIPLSNISSSSNHQIWFNAMAQVK